MKLDKHLRKTDTENMIILGVIIIGLGLAFIYPPSMEYLVKASNKSRGIATKITPTTILTYRLLGIIVTIVGVLLVTGIFNPLSY